MNWFFRIFYDYRTLQDAVQAENIARIEAEDRIRELQAQLLETRDELARARAETTDSVKHVADWMSQSLFGRKIYAAAPDVPEKSITNPEVVRSKVQARRLVNELEAEFYANFEEPVQ